ncbi:hypothetical protein T03_2190 [Trichinella britovi]|uniref:Uncharacterized protein n=1 Tax=Trichinella britovi TaxID=45882 RepID=A0A0V0Z8K8_TRIBR|nr:hypothetical protein T03_8726 [Trichinella britovi]KRY08841.1 hypothetical protein T03_16823 [Trichinella britovi]KRY08988.1 hypothetical protein T03_2190 [Trichinella britovi]
MLKKQSGSAECTVIFSVLLLLTYALFSQPVD